jgi:hypothetical protein
VRIRASYVALYKDIKNEHVHVCVYTLRKKHNLSSSVNNYKYADERGNIECMADSLKSD